MNNFFLPFNFADYKKLDEFSCSVHNKYGNNGNWLFYFRAGLTGFCSRIYGVKQHYYNMYSLHPNDLNSYEYNLTALLFHMDSAIECLNFALNALGYGVSTEGFMNITNAAGLRNICPSKTILKNPPLNGYVTYFPDLTSYWQGEKDKLLDIIRDQHDVSKHRTASFNGYDSPFDVILHPTPKEPVGIPQTEKNLHLTDIAKRFCEFINVSGQKSYKDVTTFIRL